MNIEQLYQQYIKPIPVQEQLKLISLISERLTTQSELDVEKQRSLLELEGLGAEIWQAVEAQNYVDALRDEWDEQV